ncbi:hypothetical protein GCM10023196_060310 [Actinoallomurus vinaceus]|uniref:Protein kinase domain-containing protein n=1 Tax=Actinoallomurus vinaceus TaxID=1080074 RepID=A0ABP8UGB0_9ACTN
MSHWTVPGYTELGELGSGGFGRVVLARHDDSGTTVAIKYLDAERLGGEAFFARFRDEARVLAMLDSPHVTRLYEYVEGDDQAAIVMEAVDGASLRAVLDAHGPAGPEAALSVLRGSLLGLAAAHAASVVHRDYKPANVLVQQDGQSKVADFGIAVWSGESSRPAGTPSYMAPEQWEGGPAGPATDVYAATCVFFECVTGHRPYDGDDQATLRRQHLTAPVPLDDLPEAVRPLVTRGMAKAPADRPPGALEFVAELEAAARETYGPDWERNGRRRLAEAVAGLAVLLPFAFLLGTAPGGVGAGGGGAGAGAGSGGTGPGIGAPGARIGRTTGRRLLGKTGTKVTIAITGAAIIGAAGTVVLMPKEKRHHQPPPTHAATPLTISYVPLHQRFTKPAFDIMGKYVKVGGLPNPTIEREVNRFLRLPLDQQMERYRTHSAATPISEQRKVTTTIEVGLRGPHLLSVRYRFEAAGMAMGDRVESFVSRSVTVNLTTGRRLRAQDILRPEVLTPSGVRRLIQRIGRLSPGGSLCEGGKIWSPRLSPAGIDSDDKDVRYLDLLPTATGIEFNVLLYMMGYDMACAESFVSVPYAKLSDLVVPAFRADAQRSASALPVPSPS